jgi:hypothetical protein
VTTEAGSGPQPQAEAHVTHFSEEAWSDFARNVVAEGVKVEMQQHIDRGCRKCAAAARTWQGLFAATRAEVAFMPPQDTVRIVKSQFVPPLQPSPGFRLTFDSNLQPGTAGIRGSVAATQFLFESDDYFIDLRVEPRRAEDQGCLVGQVLKRTGKERRVHALQVRLKDGDTILADAATNELGEFQLEFAGAERLCLVISHDNSHDNSQGNRAEDITLPLYGVGRKSLRQRDLDRWS